MGGGEGGCLGERGAGVNDVSRSKTESSLLSNSELAWDSVC